MSRVQQVFLGLVLNLFSIGTTCSAPNRASLECHRRGGEGDRDPSPDSHHGEPPATFNELELLLTDVKMKLSTGSTRCLPHLFQSWEMIKENLQLVLLRSCRHNKPFRAFSGSLLPPSASRLATSLHVCNYKMQNAALGLFSGSLISFWPMRETVLSKASKLIFESKC